jgi:pilus assembly protein CpaB
MAMYSNDPTVAAPGAAARPKPDARARKSKAKAMLFMALTLLLGLFSAWFVLRVVESRSRPGAIAMTKVAVAALDLPLATTLNDTHVTFVDWPTMVLPPGHYSDASAILGRVVARDIAKGEPLLEARLASGDAGLGMAAVIPATHRAMTVLVNDVIGVAGFIHPNDIVDVITTMQSSPGSQEIRSKIVLQNIRVLAVGQEMVTRDAKPVKVPVVTLLVTPSESERLALGSTQGKVQLTLRSRADVAEVRTAGVSSPDLFGRSEPTKPEPAKPGPVREHRPAARVEAKPAAPEVVEVLRGDRLEERKLRTKETP